ncbi:NPK1-related protein kinase-like [Lotmaria passim]
MSGDGETASARADGAALCRHCGAAYHKANAKFCSRCGASRDAPPTGGNSGNGDGKKRPSRKLDDSTVGSVATLNSSNGGGGATAAVTSTTTPPLFPSSKVVADGSLVVLDGGKRTLRPFDAEQLHQQQLSHKEAGENATAAASLEFRDPSATTSLTSPKRHLQISSSGAAPASLASSPTSAAASPANGSYRGSRRKSAIYAKDNTLPELPPGSLADPRRFTRHHSEPSDEPETQLIATAAETNAGLSSAQTPVPPQSGRPSSASSLTALARRRTSKSRKQETAVEDAAAFADGAAGSPEPSQSAPRVGEEEEEEEEATASLHPSAEEEAQYTAWATLPPEGLTPEMLQTSNAAELRRWRKGSLIGRGTYGSVYLGLLPDGSFFAVKSVELGNRRAATDHLNALELVSLSREINMMRRLRHRNLCTFKGVYYDAENTSINMFMEYIGGGSLSSLVKRFKPLPPSVVRSWTRQLLSGLLYLHTQHIIHRDIKGDNVLVDTSADPSTLAQIKLVDFGAARRLTDAVSQSSTVIGTPYWMAPEVVGASGEGNGYTYKADVWSVGCTVAEMLTGRPPWPSKASAPAAILMIASATGMPTEIPEAEATPGCLDFMRQCFTRDPAKRPTVQTLLHHPWIQGKTE